jgi:hypothetical protein
VQSCEHFKWKTWEIARARASELAFALFYKASAEHCSKAGGRNKIKSTLYVCDGSIYANDLLSSRRLLLPMRVSTPYGVGRVYSERRNDIRLTATRAVCLHTHTLSLGRYMHNWAAALVAAAALCLRLIKMLCAALAFTTNLLISPFWLVARPN